MRSVWDSTPPWVSIPSRGVVNAIATSAVDITDLHDRINVTDNRHAELAALVSELTVAVEALERKVEVLVSQANLAKTVALEALEALELADQGEGMT